MLDIAIALAAEKFKGVYDKGNQPYILHCLWVMDKVRHLGHDYMIVAVLHDIIEDTDVTSEFLLDLGFKEELVKAIEILSKDPNDDYPEYIIAVEENKYAVQVKLRDLEHNSKITRLKGIDDASIKRMKKYNTAYTYLKINRR